MKSANVFPSTHMRDWLSKAEGRLPTASLFCAGALLLGVALALAQTGGAVRMPENPTLPSAEATVALARDSQDTPKKGRLREGTEWVNQIGAFQHTGDRMAFFTDLASGRFIVLENLALDRISRILEDAAETPEWLVSGTITEHRGENYLLVHRAVLRQEKGSGAVLAE